MHFSVDLICLLTTFWLTVGRRRRRIRGYCCDVYAGYQYYGQRKDGTRKIKNHKGITGPYWNKKMMSAEGKDLEKDIMKYYLTGK